MMVSLISALLGSLFTAFLAYFFSKYQKFKEKNEERLSILNAFQSELSSLLSLIYSREKFFISYEPSDLPEGSLPYIPITLNYFNIFENLSAKFGLITNPELVTEIINTYAETKGLFENVKDLEYFAKLSHTLMITPSQDSERRKALVSFHNNYRIFILEDQVPSIKGKINNCINAINREKEIISSKNAVKNFFKYFFTIDK